MNSEHVLILERKVTTEQTSTDDRTDITEDNTDKYMPTEKAGCEYDMLCFFINVNVFLCSQGLGSNGAMTLPLSPRD